MPLLVLQGLYSIGNIHALGTRFFLRPRMAAPPSSDRHIHIVRYRGWAEWLSS